VKDTGSTIAKYCVKECCLERVFNSGEAEMAWFRQL
jgi:hypothetical protein